MGIPQRSYSFELERANVSNKLIFKSAGLARVRQDPSQLSWISNAASNLPWGYDGYGSACDSNNDWFHRTTTDGWSGHIQDQPYKQCILRSVFEIYKHGCRARLVAWVHPSGYKHTPSSNYPSPPERGLVSKSTATQGEPDLHTSDVDILSIRHRAQDGRRA